MDQNTTKANNLTWLGLLLNCALTLFKFIAGIMGNSAAITADAVHSLSDSSTDIVLLWGFRAANRPADKTHDYGHGKIETFVATFIGLVLCFVGIKIFWNGACDIVTFLRGGALAVPGWIAFVAAFVCVPTKEWLYHKSVKLAEEIDSPALLANAWHHRTDAISSLGVMIGIGGAILLGDKWVVLDPIAAVVVSVIILKLAIKIVWESALELTDASLNDEIEKEIVSIAASVEGIENPHKLRTRKVGNTKAIEMHVWVNPDLDIKTAHDLATQVETRLRARFGQKTFISVHVEPWGE